MTGPLKPDDIAWDRDVLPPGRRELCVICGQNFHGYPQPGGVSWESIDAAVRAGRVRSTGERVYGCADHVPDATK